MSPQEAFFYGMGVGAILLLTVLIALGGITFTISRKGVDVKRDEDK
jgi:hypothetical protein